MLNTFVTHDLLERYRFSAETGPPRRATMAERLCSRRLNVRLLLLLPLFGVAAKSISSNCTEICAYLSTQEDDCSDCCFRSLVDNQESYTSHRWHDNENFDPKAPLERLGWFRGRGRNEPIVGDDTVIAACLYTFTKNTLKLTAVFPPLHYLESRLAEVEVTGTLSGTTRNANCTIVKNAWNCLFRIDDLPASEPYVYQVSYKPDPDFLPDLVYSYEGLIPIPSSSPRIAAMGCFGPDNTWVKSSLVTAVLSMTPDLLVLQGDQTYLHSNMVYGFIETVYSIHEVTRNIPTIVQLDDHDYGKLSIH